MTSSSVHPSKQSYECQPLYSTLITLGESKKNSPYFNFWIILFISNLYLILFDFYLKSNDFILIYSSGILIILPASGNGTFHARFGKARARVRGTVSTTVRDEKTYLNVEDLDVQLSVKDVSMRVRKIFNNNRILSKFLHWLGNIKRNRLYRYENILSFKIFFSERICWVFEIQFHRYFYLCWKLLKDFLKWVFKQSIACKMSLFANNRMKIFAIFFIYVPNDFFLIKKNVFCNDDTDFIMQVMKIDRWIITTHLYYFQRRLRIYFSGRMDKKY